MAGGWCALKSVVRSLIRRLSIVVAARRPRGRLAVPPSPIEDNR
jgi:hypothetical protein